MAGEGSLSQETTKAATLASDLRARILAEQLVPGRRLGSEKELMATTGSSRPVVREALRILESEGFVEMRRGRYGGIFVSYPAAKDLGVWLARQMSLHAVTVSQLIAFRLALERAAIELACGNASAQDLAVLQRLADSRESGMEFHLAIGRASKNILIDMLLQAVNASLQGFGAYDVFTESEYGDSDRAHRRLFDHISAGRVEEAVAAMGKHLAGIEDGLRRTGRIDTPAVRFLGDGAGGVERPVDGEA